MREKFLKQRVMNIDCPHCRRPLGQVPINLREAKVCPECKQPIVRVAYEVTCRYCGGWATTMRLLHEHKPSVFEL